jgi:hypothetical protein
MELNNFSIKGLRQLRAIEALVENDVRVQDLGSIIGALNPRQTIMELRRQGFYGIIKTRRFREKDRDKKTCWPGEYYIPKEYKFLVMEVIKKCATSVCEISEAAKNDIPYHLYVEEVKKCKN